MYRLNRIAFRAMSAEEASNHANFYKNLTWQERFKITLFLNSIAYKLVDKPEPRIDKTIFKVKSRN